MERRKFVVGLGALASGSAAAMGTGAFTSVTANRQVDVKVAEDANAYLGLQNSGDANDPYFDASGDEYSVDFNSIPDDTTNGTAGGSGVNPNADTIAESVFQIVNQGTQEVTVSLSGDGDVSTQGRSTSVSAPSNDGINASLSDDEAGDATLSPGDSIDVDFAINSGTSDLSGTLTISANDT
ncbi:hypothetical protein [Halorubrum sp. 2020YC2]|uniref:hypothetical protein n=1 Tax=Halorubrum sp. 2020YC2 TaxID=2836432 RepID=UPI001BE80D47|nr:hypothetical protein [Halorubrum sp. 2020YC2]QWC18720.1 hypothetical protein KI388_11375 [Halorubrum sp. 2020YC2]